MRILFTRFPLESSYGGAEVQTMSLMKGLHANGHAAAFVGSCPTLLRLCREGGIPAVELQLGAPPVTPWKAVSFLWRRAAMRRTLQRILENFEKIDAICMLSLSEKLVLTPLALAKGIKVFWIEHDRVGRWLQKNPWLPQLLELSKKVTTITVSDLSRDVYLHMGWAPASVISIPNGIDLQRFAAVDAPLPRGARESKLHVGCVARLTPDKGVDVLVQAVSKLPGVQLSVVGRGKQENEIRMMMSEIEERTHHLQQMTLQPFVEDLNAYYKSLDIFVLPSREHDPFGLVAAEAMALGIATIVTDACGIARHLRGGEAIIVPADDAEALRKAIGSLLEEDKRVSLGSAGKDAIWERFGSEHMIERYIQVLSGTAR